MFWPIGVLYGALPVFALLLLIGSIVLVARGRRIEALNMSLAVILAASLVIAAVGLSQLLSPTLSAVLGRDFSYETVLPAGAPPMPAAEETPQPSREEQQANLRVNAENQFRDDIVYGTTMLVVGLIVFGVLALSRWFLRRWGAESGLLHETFLLLLLITTTIVALASTISAVAGLLRRYVVLPIGPDATLPHPGAAVATAIVFLPLWGWFLVRAIREAAMISARTPAPSS
jgi:hypothetical protein